MTSSSTAVHPFRVPESGEQWVEFRPTRSADPDRFPLERVYIILALLCGLFTVFAMPPLAVWDERTHWNRSFDLSEGVLSQSERFQGWPLAKVPAGVQWILDNDVNVYPKRPMTWDLLAEQWRVPLEPERRVLSAHFSTTPYGHIAYVPQAIGIAAARAVGSGPIGMIWAGRLVSLVVCTGIVALALRITPCYRLLMFALALLPVFVGLTSSLSGDALFQASALLLLALIFRVLERGTAGPTTPEVVAICLLSLVIGLCRIPYVLMPFLLAGAALTWQHRQRTMGLAAGLVVVLAITAGWAKYATTQVPEKHTVPGYECSPKDQAAFIAQRPLSTVLMLEQEFRKVAKQQLEQLPAWPCSGVPRYETLITVVAAWGLLLLLVVVDRPTTWSFPVATQLAAVGTCTAITGAICLSIYLWWNAPGASTLLGLQPRYFLPLVVIGAIAVSWLPLTWQWDRRWLVPLTVGCSMVVFSHSAMALLDGYWAMTPRLRTSPEATTAATCLLVGVWWWSVERRRPKAAMIDVTKTPIETSDTPPAAEVRPLRAVA